MGVVYEAYDHGRDMRVALKTLHRLDATRLLRLKSEFRALSTLSHPNIVGLYELFSEADEWFFTMELVEGEDLVSYVGLSAPEQTASSGTGGSARARQASADRGDTARPEADSASPWHQQVDRSVPRPGLDELLDPQRLREVMAQLARALHALHAAKLIHCDLKPSNVMVTREGRVVLMDFGLAASRARLGEHQGGNASDGTPAYMAPEQARGEAPTPAADWYAFGVILYQLLTARLPFEGSLAHILLGKQEADPLPPQTFTADIPKPVAQMCQALLSRDPGQRPVATQVLAVLGGDSVAEPGAGDSIVQAIDAGADIFVGRDVELAALHNSYERTSAGDTRCVIVEALSGMGKSSLVEYFLLELQQVAAYREAPLILAGRCHERESVAYKALDGIIDQLATHLLVLSENQRRSILPADIALLARLFPVLERVPGCESGPGPGASLEVRVRAMRALGGLISHLAASRPVVIRIEDLQWADDESFELLLALLEPPAPAGLLLLTTVRRESLSGANRTLTGFVESLERRDITRRISLGPLSQAEQRALVRQLGQQRSLRQRIDDALWRECGGHPMLLAELARYAEQAADELAPRKGLHLEDIIWQRVSRLPRSARLLLDVIAVAGEPVPLHILSAVAALDPAERERARSILSVTRLARLARVGAELWLDSFHDKVREAVLERLGRDRLRGLHARLARAMDGWETAPTALLARHWLAAGEREKAADYLLSAAQSVSEQLAFARAAEFYRNAISILADAPDNREIDLRRIQAWLALAKDLRVVDRDDEALLLIGRALEAAKRHNLVDRLADGYRLRGNLLYNRGELDRCLEANERARRYARQAGSPRREAAALSGLGDAYYLRGQLLSAYGHYDGCIGLCRQHGFGDLEAANLAMRGVMHWFQNDLEGALRDGRAAVVLARRHGRIRVEVNARSICLALVLLEMGRLDDAATELLQARDIARELGARRFEATTLLFLGRVCQLQGREAKAELLVGDSIELFRQTGLAYMGPIAFAFLALVTDRPALRDRAVAHAERLLRAGSGSHNHLYFYRHAMELALEHGNFTRAEHYADTFEDYMRAQPVPWSHFFIARTRALVQFARGRRDERTKAWLRALEHEASRVGLEVAATALRDALAQAK